MFFLFEDKFYARKKERKIYTDKITTIFDLIWFERMVFTAFIIRDGTRIISKKKIESGGFHGIKQNKYRLANIRL